MQHDNVIWESVYRHFCSYRVATVKQKFCRNRYNLTGLCERRSCPLANSRYATIVENDGRLYLFVKTAERAHAPRKMWQRLRLAPDYRRALRQLDRHLQHWPPALVHKAKQRLTKMTHYLVRRRRLQLRAATRLVAAASNKVHRREAAREKKAVAAAALDATIEKELLQRLHTGAYGDIYNFAQAEYESALDAHLDAQQQHSPELEQPDAHHLYEAQYDDSDDDDEHLLHEQDIEHLASDPDYDFDDSDDHSLHSSSDLDNDHQPPPPTAPRSPSELDEYVRHKARKRALANKPSSVRGKGSKGRKLRRASGGVRIEVEYERETETQPHYAS